LIGKLVRDIDGDLIAGATLARFAACCLLTSATAIAAEYED
jgi:hypothetical protein